MGILTDRRIALALLAHGPMPMREFAECTGWAYSRAHRVLRALLLDGYLKQPRKGVYQVRETSHLAWS